jgi:hypothetical protein
MLNSVAVVQTATPKRFMVQLCKHFEHKLPVSQDGSEGRIEFSIGTCRMQATDDTLVLRAEAADTDTLGKLQDVVARHLVRFAFRAAPEVVWQAA